MADYQQSVTADDIYNPQLVKTFSMIDNYVYLYHTDTLIAIPLYPESIQDSMSVEFNQTHPLSRSAPIFSYSKSGPRTLQIEIPLHRDMMHEINLQASNLKIDALSSDDYVDILVKQLQAAALPKYGAAQKMVNPPIVAVRFGADIFCKGVVQGSVTCTHSGVILQNNKYSLVTVSFAIAEIDPYDAESVMSEGGYRGIRSTLESRVWKTKPQ